MKKLLTLALAVLGFTAAQAATISWTGDASGDLSQTVSFAEATKFYVSVTLSGDLESMWNGVPAQSGPNPTRPDMVTLKDSTGKAVLDLNFRKQGGWSVQVNGIDKLTGSTSGFLDNYLTDITVVFEATKTAGVWGDIAVTVSGKKGTDIRTLTGTITDTSIITNIASVEIGAALPGTVNGETVDFAIPSTTVVVSNTVPEPTALALLALGVAGLALKRKHA